MSGIFTVTWRGDRGTFLLACAALLAGVLLGACGERLGASPGTEDGPIMKDEARQEPGRAESVEVATLGAGCFWCVEAVLQQVDGVLELRSGYTGGQVPDPTYEQVCSGRTGHAEVVQVTFDPKRLGYEELLEWFWQLHDPTTKDRQGNDVGTQYRSVIFFHSDEQRRIAEQSKAKENASGRHGGRPVVTEIVKAGPFYAAERYHQDYYRTNPEQPYCQIVIAPKLEKLGLEK